MELDYIVSIVTDWRYWGVVVLALLLAACGDTILGRAITTLSEVL